MGNIGGKRPGAGRKPGQVSAAKRELADMAKDHAGAALAALASIAADGQAPAAARVAASVALLDRAYGRPRPMPEEEAPLEAHSIKVEFVNEAPPDFSKLTDEELLTLNGLMDKARSDQP